MSEREWWRVSPPDAPSVESVPMPEKDQLESVTIRVEGLDKDGKKVVAVFHMDPSRLHFASYRPCEWDNGQIRPKGYQEIVIGGRCLSSETEAED